MLQTGWSERRGLRQLTVHQLFSFFDLGLVVTELSRNDLHSAGDLLLQTSLMLTFGAALATARPLDTGEILGLIKRTARLTRLGTGSLGFGRDGLVWVVLW